MGLLARVSNYDSVQTFERAQVDRFWDALVCAVEGRHFIGCYLYGYVAEMILKCAYFRNVGVTITSDLKQHLQTARQQPRMRLGRNLHDLVAWADLIIEARRMAGRSLNPALAGELVLRIGVVETHWKESLRYRPSIAAQPEAEEMNRTVEWLVGKYYDLWS